MKIKFKTKPKKIENNIYYFLDDTISNSSKEQEKHFNEYYVEYKKNRDKFITKSYMQYISDEFNQIIEPNVSKKISLELASGAGELSQIFKKRIKGYALDISEKMLRTGSINNKDLVYLHADALDIPLKDNSVNIVFIIGGIHHIPDLERLFSEISRVLITGGSFYFIEPLDDFVLWRCIRKVIYKFSPALDEKNEHPIRRREVNGYLEKFNLKCEEWKTLGFFGFALLMNSDILKFNHLFEILPFRSLLVKFLIGIDKIFSKLPFFKSNGMVAISKYKKN